MAKENWQIWEDVRYWLSEASIQLVFHKRDGSPIEEAHWRFQRAAQALQCLKSDERNELIYTLPNLPAYEEMFRDMKAREVPPTSSLLIGLTKPHLSDWEKLEIEDLCWFHDNLWDAKI